MRSAPKYILIGAGLIIFGGVLISHFRPKHQSISERREESVLVQPPPNEQIILPPPSLADNDLILDARTLKLKRNDIAIKSLSPKLTPEQIRAKVGRPTKITDDPPYHDPNSEKDLPLQTWHYDGLDIHILNGRVAQITALSWKWPTAKGLKVGDTLARAVTLYGAPTEVREYDLVYCWEPGNTSFCPLTISISSANVVGAITYDEWPD